MTTTTQTLADFILARLAEDEAVAQRARRHYQHVLGIPHYFTANSDTSVAMSPPTALADIEAKRRIVALHNSPEGTDYCVVCVEHDYEDTPWPCPTLRALAQPYRDHPEWREEWAL